jgi:cyanophycinase-like exopeptidase
VVLMGGGTEVDSSMRKMCEWANGGDFLVIRATGTDAYNPYLEVICPDLNSVATLVIPSESAAADPFVAQTIREAEAIWIAGGAQDDYINYWTGTPVQHALNTSISNGVPIGGTSAGLAVLTQYVYSALGSKGVTSAQALADPYNRYVTLASDFVNLPVLAGIIGDTHFATRDRMGRALAFLCRITNEGWGEPRAIAVDEETALEIPAQGSATVASNKVDGSAYFLSPTGPADNCAPKVPLTFRNVDVYRVGASGTFDLGAWTGSGGTSYQVSAESGVLSSTQAGGSIY